MASTHSRPIGYSCCCCSGLQAVCHVQIMRRWSSNLEQWTIQRPRLWEPRPYSLSPTRRSKPAFQWQGTNERIHRQWQQGTKQTQNRHEGHQFTYGYSVTSLVTGGNVFFSEQPGETMTQQRGNSYCVFEPKHLSLPFRKFLRLSKPRSWTGDPEHVKYRSISLGPLAHAGLDTLYKYILVVVDKSIYTLLF